MQEEHISEKPNPEPSNPDNLSTDKAKIHGPKPKKPMSAYFHFMIEKSKEAKFSKKEIGELWGLMDSALRQKYICMAEDEKKRYLEWMRQEEEIQKSKDLRKTELQKNLRTIKEDRGEHSVGDSGDEPNPNRIHEEGQDQYLEDAGGLETDDPNDAN